MRLRRPVRCIHHPNAAIHAISSPRVIRISHAEVPALPQTTQHPLNLYSESLRARNGCITIRYRYACSHNVIWRERGCKFSADTFCTTIRITKYCLKAFAQEHQLPTNVPYACMCKHVICDDRVDFFSATLDASMIAQVVCSRKYPLKSCRRVASNRSLVPKR